MKWAGTGKRRWFHRAILLLGLCCLGGAGGLVLVNWRQDPGLDAVSDQWWVRVKCPYQPVVDLRGQDVLRVKRRIEQMRPCLNPVTIARMYWRFRNRSNRPGVWVHIVESGMAVDMIWMNPDGTYAGLKVDYYQDGDVGVLVGAPGVIRVLTAGEDHEEIYRTFIGKRQTE